MKQKWYPNIFYLSVKDSNQISQIDILQIHIQVLRYHLEDKQEEALILIRESANSISDTLKYAL